MEARADQSARPPFIDSQKNLSNQNNTSSNNKLTFRNDDSSKFKPDMQAGFQYQNQVYSENSKITANNFSMTPANNNNNEPQAQFDLQNFQAFDGKLDDKSISDSN